VQVTKAGMSRRSSAHAAAAPAWMRQVQRSLLLTAQTGPQVTGQTGGMGPPGTLAMLPGGLGKTGSHAMEL
jgi:hypothetical protein